MLLYATVKKCGALFKAGRESIDDDLRNDHSTNAATDGSMKDVEKFVMEDRHVLV